MKVPGNSTEALRLARQLGWEVRRSRHGWRLRHPEGATMTLHWHGKGPGDWRALRNWTVQLQRTERR